MPLTGIYGTVVGLPTGHAYEVVGELLPEFAVAGERYRFETIFGDNAWTGAGGVAAAGS